MSISLVSTFLYCNIFNWTFWRIRYCDIARWLLDILHKIFIDMLFSRGQHCIILLIICFQKEDWETLHIHY